MIFNRYEWRLLLRVFLLLIVLTVTAFVIVSLNQLLYLVILLPLVAYSVVDMIRFQKKAQDEVNQFVESIHYRDFSRHFDVRKAPNELKPLRKGFNDINTTFKLISRERETQYHYLQKILELVDTGILSYEEETGDTGWINEAFKTIIGVPYLKTVHSLEKREPSLYAELIKLKPGDSKIITVTRNQQQVKILVNASLMRSDDKLYKLIAFQNVNEALDETESKAWSKLLNVMTHEIMNSVAPISSLADTLKNRLQSPDIAESLPHSDLEDIELGIDTIKRRSEGLLKFTESYRSLNKITKLDLNKIMVRNIFENLNSLMTPTLEKKKIELEIILRDPTLAIEADINLIEQVMINLLVNAIEAVKDRETPRITLTAEIQGGKTFVKVIDNGLGMPPELLDKIFIPFFSTRKTGSGIGLSLCKQIMLLHKGNIQVQSTEGKGSAFILSFV
ncbi:HAMP domain-containing histidine kinase [Mucilaginibacter rubeus]|uniref:histidine kinase n=1 Tax=Mucilaginibacter rubeus TaxID=2027860 RepID=A0AAE6MIE8_9SPHI|nr:MULTISPECIES: HAMP domain-containing sensor histidine kinase [Mucilaginibacter]QEM04144.1 HAMP domain-containing histidine kinase [Mucilaginibacter rubeus]QEM16746.1 HAMP domain-containing histidine kinase [Mucilaginibacter gossypii]QTE46776.1 HAMP domain-containing histidine kinase [Mucilaginibacter rubeus]QTE53373.1 HAMP domain-containing histidine kinase [Mucilaginibacter rubeus]QTE58459.1 HAMP domain-containing histidine kinase [Mucilaginibacter rubeus]